MALYNKYECKALDDIVGQDTSIGILKHDIETNKFPNCYCFAGKYGCGKSNTAKIFAKTINAYTYTIDSSMFNKAENKVDIEKNNEIDVKPPTHKEHDDFFKGFI